MALPAKITDGDLQSFVPIVKILEKLHVLVRK